MKNKWYKWHVSIVLTLLISLSICLAINVGNSNEWESLFNVVLIAVNIHSLLLILED